VLTYEGQYAVNPKPLAKVQLNYDVRNLCWQLLGPPPEKEDSFYRHFDGTPMERPKKFEPVAKPKKSRPKKKTK